MSVFPRVAVIGSVNVDIRGCPSAAFVPGDSNPGSVTTALGGVGANIARNLRLLGCDVLLVTALGGDAYGALAGEQLAREGIDLSAALRVPEARTSTYLYITDEAGDMRAAVADMRIQERLTPELLAGRLGELNAREGVVIDANLSAESLHYICAHVTAPIFADGVSAAKVGKLRPVLPRLAALKLNRIEAEELTGGGIRSEDDLRRAARWLAGQGLRRFCITLGAAGALYCGPEGAFRAAAMPPDGIANTTGAGDAFTAGLIWSLLSGEGGLSAVGLASAAASLALEADQAVNPDLSAERVRHRRRAHEKNCFEVFL